MDMATRIEIGILATMDGVWVPLRDWKPPRPTNVYTARRLYHSHGVPWRSGGVTDSELKAKSRALQDLKDAGRVEAWQPRLKSLRVRLAEAAEVETRARCGLPPLAAAVAAVRELTRHCNRNPKTLDKLWVPEVRMNNGKGWDMGDTSGLVLVEEMLLAALSRQWVVSLSSVARHVYYAVTPDGWDAMRREHPAAPKVKRDRAAEAIYYAQLKHVLAGWDNEPPGVVRDLGAIPLPVGHDGMEIGCWPADRPHEPVGPEEVEAAEGGPPDDDR